ncbi:MAG: T9SS type A sorting domain-containing protein, partial [Cytophagales bacterium]|nr:T9SS type A sorting domain-containing protein [Cytophagales bacterium]
GTSISDSASFNLLPQTGIVLQPKDTTLCSENLGQFIVFATGTGLNYIWSDGTIGQTLLTSTAGIYTTTVSGTCGTSISNPASLTVLPKTGITSQPVSATACIDSSASFTVIATGSGLNYRWSEGTNAPTLTTSIPSFYTVTVFGTCGTSISNTIQLSSTNTCTGTVTTLDNNTEASTLQIFPNPTNGLITISIPKPSDYKIMDGVGSVVKNGFLNQGRNTIILELSQGIYYFISTGEVKKLVVN